jgi:hypothetical protein
LFQVSQVILQTPLIIDGLRRCSSLSSLYPTADENDNRLLSSNSSSSSSRVSGSRREKKPGRELVTFLVVCNLSVWVMETFEMNNKSSNHHSSDQIRFYGTVPYFKRIDSVFEIDVG